MTANRQAEQTKLIRWMRGWLDDYTTAKRDGDDAAMLQTSEDLEIAASRLHQMAQEDGV